MAREIIIHTSVDDLRSSLNCMLNNGYTEYTQLELQSYISLFKKNIEYEKKNSNRATVIKLLESTIKKLEKKINLNTSL